MKGSLILKVLSGIHAGAEMLLHPRRSYAVGQNPSCDIIIADSLMQAQHALITITDTNVKVSQGEGRVLRNGELQMENTFLLEPFDVITMGTTHLALAPDNRAWPSIKLPSLDKVVLYANQLKEGDLDKKIQDKKDTKKNKAPIKFFFSSGNFFIWATSALVLVLAIVITITTVAEKKKNSEPDIKTIAMLDYRNKLNQLLRPYDLNLEETTNGFKVDGYMSNHASYLNLKRQMKNLVTNASLDLAIVTPGTIQESLSSVINNSNLGTDIKVKSSDDLIQLIGSVPSEKDMSRLKNEILILINLDKYKKLKLKNLVEVKYPIPEITINVKGVSIGGTKYITLDNGRRYKEGDTILNDFTIVEIHLDKLKLKYKNNEFIYYLNL